jgi:cold shock CspA family protein/ribosome-associated translation inhibitor RaiA
MQIPLQVTYRGMESSDSVDAAIREKAKRLERFHGRITSCRVTVESPAQHRRKGGTYRVTVDLTVPSAEIATSRKSGRDAAHEDVYVAIRDAFAAATRRLEDHARERRGDVKTHEVPTHGRIVRLDPSQEFGFIETSEGLEVYFHRNSLIGSTYEALGVGDEVRLSVADQESARGPQASTVEPIHKHHVVG